MGKPRLPWKRGPRAYEIALRAEQILQNLYASQRKFYSLRKASGLFGISTQPLREWLRLGYLERDGPRRQISRIELEKFINFLRKRAKPYDKWNYINRIEHNRKIPSWEWRKIIAAEFVWPKGRDTLKPSELASLIGCHPSLIIKAIHACRIRGFRPTPCRWALKRRSWKW